MLVYECMDFNEVQWIDNPKLMSQTILINIPYSAIATKSEDLELKGIQLIFEKEDY